MVDLQQLISSRIQLHYAIQFMAAISNALAVPQPDGSHVTSSWETEQQLFTGIPIADRFQAALDPIGLNATLLDLRGNLADGPQTEIQAFLTDAIAVSHQLLSG